MRTTPLARGICLVAGIGLICAILGGIPARAEATVAKLASTDVGVVPAGPSCPIGSEAIIIRMDDEDDSNSNRTDGNIGAINNVGNTTFFFCRVDGAALHAFQPQGSGVQPFAVLKLGHDCPNGSREFTRYFDNEDDDNANYTQGDIYPNESGGNTTLRFCLFAPGIPTMSAFPDYGFGYLTFSNVNMSGSLYIDDEDDDNADAYNAPGGLLSVATAIVSDGPNTTMNLRISR